MTREDITQEVLGLKGNNFLLELPTGTGKSKIAIEKIKDLSLVDSRAKILIVVPRNVHKKSWENEIKKWWPKCPFIITYTTYVSFPKYKGYWDYIIFDECHHLSERCREALYNFTIKYSILCSATVNKGLKDELRGVFKNLIIYKKNLREVIDNKILPDPTVYLIPLTLKNSLATENIWKNKGKSTRVISCSYAERWNYIKQKTTTVRVYCTETQYYSDLSSQIEYWKNLHMRTKSIIARNKWLRLCNDRLRWLSDKKVSYIKTLLNNFKDCRTLVFCNSIKQTESLGEYCINSKNKDSVDNLEQFNIGTINHITACNMLNENMNLVNCQIGIYANLNGSEAIIKQRMGRLLRHKNPVLIIPYYKNTREEEIVQKMLENYNLELVKTISNIKEIKL